MVQELTQSFNLTSFHIIHFGSHQLNSKVELLAIKIWLTFITLMYTYLMTNSST